MARRFSYPLPLVFVVIWIILAFTVPMLVPMQGALRLAFGWGMILSFIFFLVITRYAWEIKIKSFLVAKIWVYDGQKVVYEDQVMLKGLDSMTYDEYIRGLSETLEEEVDLGEGGGYVTILYPEKPFEYLGKKIHEVVLISSDALERLVPPHEAWVVYNDLYYRHRYVYFLPCKYIVDLRVEDRNILILQLVIDHIEPTVAANLIAAKYRVELDRVKLELKRKDELIDVITREETSVEEMQRNFTDHIARHYQDLWRGLKEHNRRPFYKNLGFYIAVFVGLVVAGVVLDFLGIIPLRAMLSQTQVIIHGLGGS